MLARPLLSALTSSSRVMSIKRLAGGREAITGVAYRTTQAMAITVPTAVIRSP